MLQVLFFVRLFADMTGRTLPRKKALALTSQRLLFALSCLVAVTMPLFFLYLKSPPRFHSDWLSIGDPLWPLVQHSLHTIPSGIVVNII